MGPDRSINILLNETTSRETLWTTSGCVYKTRQTQWVATASDLAVTWRQAQRCFLLLRLDEDVLFLSLGEAVLQAPADEIDRQAIVTFSNGLKIFR